MVGWGRSCRVSVVATVAATILAGCGSPAPSVDDARVLNVENRVGQAVMVSVSPRGEGTHFQSWIRACGGRLALTVGREIPTGDDWMVFLSFDPTGQVDDLLATAGDDPNDLEGTFPASIVWSRGDIRTADLPAWVTIEPDGTTMTATPASGAPTAPCPTLAPESGQLPAGG